jgi:hypothetical protein
LLVCLLACLLAACWLACLIACLLVCLHASLLVWLLAGAVFAETATINFAKNKNYVKPHLHWLSRCFLHRTTLPASAHVPEVKLTNALAFLAVSCKQ